MWVKENHGKSAYPDVNGISEEGLRSPGSLGKRKIRCASGKVGCLYEERKQAALLSSEFPSVETFEEDRCYSSIQCSEEGEKIYPG